MEGVTFPCLRMGGCRHLIQRAGHDICIACMFSLGVGWAVPFAIASAVANSLSSASTAGYSLIRLSLCSQLLSLFACLRFCCCRLRQPRRSRLTSSSTATGTATATRSSTTGSRTIRSSISQTGSSSSTGSSQQPTSSSTASSRPSSSKRSSRTARRMA